MRFKEWLITEGGVAGSAGEFFYKLSLYPTDAFDGGEAFIDPKDVWALQGRWKIETKEGRKFHNLNKQEYLNKKFTTVQSLAMPGQSKWKHSKNDKPDIKVHYINDMDYMGVKKTDASKPNILNHKVLNTYGLPLDKIFGDQIKEPGNISSNFDKPWKRVYENVTPYQDVGTTRGVNTNLGVRSKWVGPDETGEKEGNEETPIADFGFDNPYLQKHQSRAYIQGKLRRRNGKSKSQNYV